MSMNVNTPVITIAARSGVGKTSFLEQLIPRLKERHIKLAVIKHDVHGFDIDSPGKDTYRFTQAGADIVAISGAEKFAVIERRQDELTLDEIIARLPKVDLILTEGYKTGPYPKIEIHRKASGHQAIITSLDERLFLMADEQLDIEGVCYDLDRIDQAAEHICRYISGEGGLR